eukprot:1342858-Amphidinium_carterae.1
MGKSGEKTGKELVWGISNARSLLVLAAVALMSNLCPINRTVKSNARKPQEKPTALRMDWLCCGQQGKSTNPPYDDTKKKGGND